MRCVRFLLLAGSLLIPAGLGCGQKGGSGGQTAGTAAEAASAAKRDKLLGTWLLEKTEAGGEAGKTTWEFVDAGGAGTEKGTLKAVSANQFIIDWGKDGGLATYVRQGPPARGTSKAERLVGRWFLKDGDGSFRVFTKDGKDLVGTQVTEAFTGKKVDVVFSEGTFKVQGDTLTDNYQQRGSLRITSSNPGTPAPIGVRWQLKGDKLMLEPYENSNFARIEGASNYTLKMDGANRFVLVDAGGKKMEFTKQGGGSGGGSK